MSNRAIAERAMEYGKGILRLAPAWVPRSFCIPGRRLKLHPDDYYALGGERGGIDERWLASTIKADNGPLTGEEEGLSQVLVDSSETPERLLLRDVIEELGAAVIGERLWSEYQSWPMFAKFFDNKGGLPHHIHHDDAAAAFTGQLGKPEAYYFPAQLNNHGGDFPFTFFGLEPGTTRAQVGDALRAFAKGDNKITSLSRAYRLDIATGWDVPPGLLHAPGSMCTYEPQRASDVFAMYQSLVGNSVVAEELLWKNTPPERMGDIDYLLDVINWDLNLDTELARNRFMRPAAVRCEEEMAAEGYHESWICYKSECFSAKELTVAPGQSVKIYDAAAYGLVNLQGHGRFGIWPIESPAMIRFGQLTYDEYFVSESAAREGVKIVNNSLSEPLVILKHFGPGNPEWLKFNQKEEETRE